MKELKFYKTKLKAFKLIGMSIPFVLIGLFFIFEKPVDSSGYFMAWFTTCFFGLGIPIGIYQLFDTRPQIIFTVNGVWDRTLKQNEIKWEQILDAYPIDIYEQRFISIVVDETFKFKSKPKKWISKFNNFFGAQNLNLNLGQLNVDANELTELIHRLKSVEKYDRYDILKKFQSKNTTSGYSSTFIKILLYIFISIIILFISFSGLKAFMTIMIIMGVGAIIARWYSGTTNDSIIRKYAKIVTWLGLINMVLMLFSLKIFEYYSESVGEKLTIQIEKYKDKNSFYPININSIKQEANLNLIEKMFANQIEYKYLKNDYELRIYNLMRKEKSYDEQLKIWK